MSDSNVTYLGAGQGRRLRAFRPSSSGPNSSLQGLSTLLSRARHNARNDAWEVTALDKRVANGIATGIQAKALWGTKEQQKQINKLWKSWLKTSDADGVLDFYGQQALAWREWDEAGEVFVRLRMRRASDGLPVPLQVQLIEAEQCPQNYYGVAPNGNAIRRGIEFDRIGRRTAYWMYQAHPGDLHMGEVNPLQLVRVPAEQIRHLYRPLRAGQLRGVPGSASVLVRQYGLDRLQDNVLERQAIANLFTGFFEVPPGDEEDGPGGGPIRDLQSSQDPDGTPLGGLEPGTMQELPPGYKVSFSEPPTAGSEYAEFLRTNLMAVAAVRGVPYEVLTGDLRNISDRALRLILNEFRRRIEMDQWLYLIPQLCQFVREAFFDQAVLAGKLTIPGYAEARDDVVETLWVPEGWPYSHPVQDVDADVKAIRAGLTSRTRRTLAQGEDPESVMDELASDNAAADERGLVLDSDPRMVSAAGLTQARPAGTRLPDTTGEDGEDAP